jgi:hypothetical protein
VPPDSVRCTRVNQLELATFGFLEKPLRYNSPDCPVWHRIVRCASGATSTAQWSTPMETCKSAIVRTVRAESEQAPEGAPDSVQWLSGAPPVSHPVLEGKPNVNHVRVRISNSRTQQLHNMDIITQCSNSIKRGNNSRLHHTSETSTWSLQ